MTADRRIALAQAGDRAALEGLLADNAPLVWSVARRFFGRGTEADDLFQLGSIGLMKAVRDFDLTLGVAFSTYAVPKIAGEIRRFLRDDGPVKVSRTLRERAALLRSIERRVEAETGCSPRLSRLCRESGLSPEEVTEALNAPRDTESLDAPVAESRRTLGELLPAAGDEEQLAQRVTLLQAIRQLEPVQRRVILLRYARDLTQAAAGQALGMSQVQVSRTEKRAIAALRAAMAEP